MCQTRSLSLGALAVMLGVACTAVSAQTPILQWAFDGDKGYPAAAETIRGGVLQIDAHGAGFAAFESTGGVSAATPGVLNAANNLYGDEAGSAHISSIDSPLRTQVVLSQFVVMLWIKPTLGASLQPYARLLTISPEDSEKGRPGIFISTHTGNLEVGVNGSIALMPLPAGTIKEGEWTFIVLVYDGVVANPYYSLQMREAVNTDRNAALLTGSVTTPVKVVGNTGMNTGAPDFKTSTGPVPLNGLNVAIGSGNGNWSRAFCGLIDDIRIYNGLLTLEQIEAIRLSSAGQR